MTLHEPSWDEARAAAFAAAQALPAVRIPIVEALHSVLAEPLVAQSMVPSFDTSMMDGWAVAGDGPWEVRGRVLAGTVPPPLPAGAATEIATGAPVPNGATAVLRREWGSVTEEQLSTDRALAAGDDIRRAGDEAHIGDVLLPAGTVVTPPIIGLAGLVGIDVLTVRKGATVQVLVLGDEIVTSGVPAMGKVRDALGVQVASWSQRFATTDLGVTYVQDTLDAHVHALQASTAHIVFTTGGTARGPVDHMHDALQRLGATLLIDEVRVRPGHPMLLAQLPDGRFVVGLPGNPLAAVTGYLTLAEPLLFAMHGLPMPALATCTTTEAIQAPQADNRIIPATSAGPSATPTSFWGSAMLRGIAQSDCMLVSDSGGTAAGGVVRVLPLPWVSR